jgi:hypothetical protein
VRSIHQIWTRISVLRWLELNVQRLEQNWLLRWEINAQNPLFLQYPLLIIKKKWGEELQMINK